ncbi:MAG TPA: cbb3-type cytochrome c oxidase subunit I [Candidatus Limnocylindria bacterium]
MTVNPKVNPKKLRPYDQPPKRRRSLIPSAPDSAAIGFLVAAVLWLALATGIGMLAAYLRFAPFEVIYPLGFFGLNLELNPARVDQAFMNAIVYGWLTNAGFAAATFIAPRLSGRRLVAEPILVLAVLLWNATVFGGIAALYVFDSGANSALTSFPWFVQGGLATGALIVALAFVATVAPAIRSAYVSLWFAGIGLLSLAGLTGLSAAMGLADFIIGLDDAIVALGSLFIGTAVILMWLLPMAYAVLYYLVPLVAGRPLESAGLAALAFVSWLLVAPVASLSLVVDTRIPYFVTSLAGAATIALLLPAALTVVNLVLTVRGRWPLFFGTGPIAFVAVAMAFLIASGMLDAIGTLPSVRAFVGGTDWGRGVLVWNLLGMMTLAALAFIAHALPRLLRRDWGSSRLSAAQLWCVFAGATIAGIALMGAGMAEGSFRAQGADAEALAAGLYGYQLVAFAGFALVALGGLAALVNVFLAYTTGEPADYVVPGQATAAATGH